jgi:hypothetical protein
MEIDKLRLRLSNAGKNATEYRMTVVEARNLLKEFEEMEQKLKEKPIPINVISVPPPQSQIFDGGTF